MSEKKFKHLMLDIETMGNQSYSSILSIGAVEFDIETGDIGDSIHIKVDLEDCVKEGLVLNTSTVLWWMQQSDEARARLLYEGDSLKTALEKLDSFFIGKDYEVWGNSARFDCGILQNAYNKIGSNIPWDFRKERCVRTLVSFAPEIKENCVFEGVPHDALDDCKFQIKYCSEIWQKLKR